MESGAEIPRRRAVAASLLFALAVAAFLAGRATRLEGGTLTDLALGRAIAGAVPAQDPLSHSAGGAPWIQGSWLGEVSLYLAYRVGGFGLVAALEIALLLGACAAAHELACLRSRAFASRGVVFLELGALSVLAPATTERWSLLLLAVALLLVEKIRDAPSWPRALLLGVALGLAGHLDGDFFAVFGAVALALVGSPLALSGARLRRAPALWASGSLLVGGLAFALHPSGFAALVHPLDYVLDPRVRQVFFFVPELRATDMTGPSGLAVEAVLVALLGVAFTQRWRPRPADLLLIVVFAHAALVCERAVPFFVVAAAGPLGAALGAAFAPAEGSGYPDRSASLALAAGLAAALAPGFGSTVVANQAEAFAMAAHLATREGNVWHEVPEAGALEWTFAGRKKVWIDDRAALFTAAGVWGKHVKIAAAAGSFEDLLLRHRIDLVLVRPGSRLEEVLLAKGWKVERNTGTLQVLARPR